MLCCSFLLIQIMEKSSGKSSHEEQSPGERLRAARVGQRMPLREVASRAGISQATLSRIERGKQTLDVDMLVRIAEILGKEPQELFGEAHSTPAQIVGSLSAAERIEFWQLMARSAEVRAEGEKHKKHSRDLVMQVEELLAQLDYLRTEVEVVRSRLRRRA